MFQGPLTFTGHLCPLKRDLDYKTDNDWTPHPDPDDSLRFIKCAPVTVIVIATMAKNDILHSKSDNNVKIDHNFRTDRTFTFPGDYIREAFIYVLAEFVR